VVFTLTQIKTDRSGSLTRTAIPSAVSSTSMRR
jgi:hypothetical protein